MKHPFPEISSRAAADIAALDPDLQEILERWIERLVNGRIPRSKTRELDTVPREPAWWVADFTSRRVIVFRGLGDDERRRRGGAQPPEFLIRCICSRAMLAEEIAALLDEYEESHEAELEAETEEEEIAREATAKAEREAEERKASR